jgi:hypothetical protein
VRVKRAGASGCGHGGVRGTEALGTHVVARIDLPTIQHIQGSLRPTDTEGRYARHEERCAEHHSSGHDPGPSSSPREAVTRIDQSLVTAGTKSTTEIPLSRNEVLGHAEAEAGEADPETAHDDAPTTSALSFTISGEDQSIGSDAHQGPMSSSDGSIAHAVAHDDLVHRYIQLPIGDLPHQVAFGEIQHIRELLDRPRGRYWLQESPDHLRCPHCPWG